MTTIEAKAILVARDAEGVAETCRSTRQVLVAPDLPAATHDRQSGYWLDGADQHRAAVALLAGDRVKAPVHPIHEVHVGKSGRAVEDARSRRDAGRGVTRGILGTDIGLRFDDTPSDDAIRGAVLQHSA